MVFYLLTTPRLPAQGESDLVKGKLINGVFKITM